jgi:nucleoside-diphosphate-sugar epimerase
MRLVHVDDVARAIVDFLEPARFQSGKVVNLTHPDTLLARDVAALLRHRRGLRVCYLRSWMGKTLATATRITHRLLGKGPCISARQAAYLFSKCGASAQLATELGWRPAAPLRAQLEALQS